LAAKEQSYPVLLNWWAAQNRQHRHLWPGISNSNDAAEIVNQIRLTRQQPGAGGNVQWSVKALMHNKGGVTDALLKEVYTQPALVPPSPWLDGSAPSSPKNLTANGTGKLGWQPAGGEPVWLWAVQTKNGSGWRTDILPGRQTTYTMNQAGKLEVIAVTAVDRCGNASAPTVVELQH